jgi:hypothetical protein
MVSVPLQRCVIGIGRFVGRPPWERHPNFGEMLHVATGHSDLTILSENGPGTLRLFLVGCGIEITVTRRSRFVCDASRGERTLLDEPHAAP